MPDIRDVFLSWGCFSCTEKCVCGFGSSRNAQVAPRRGYMEARQHGLHGRVFVILLRKSRFGQVCNLWAVQLAM